VKQYKPKLSIPKAIVEGKNVTLECSANIYGINGSLKWKFRPPGAQRFFDLTINPVTSHGWANCTTTLNSSLDFLPRSADNGSAFRCEVVVNGIDVPEPMVADSTFLVVPSKNTKIVSFAFILNDIL